MLLPCFNAAPFLKERIDSILAQTFQDWEAIVLDSYSNDGSWECFESTASTDSRFRLYQIPREGVYAALNRGIQLAAGEFLHVATCDDTMAPEFLSDMLGLFTQCPEAGIAACDVSLINRNGGELTATDMADYLPAESINDLLGLSAVRYASYGEEKHREVNYRPPPHDCLLHFSGKSVYFSLNQLLIRTALVRSIEPFDTSVGSIADLGWLVRLTNLAGTVHVPRKLATWRFCGDQLSIQPDKLRLDHVKAMLELAVPQVYRRHERLLTRNECAVLMLPAKAYLATSRTARRRMRFEACMRVLWMYVRKPAATLRAVQRTRFSIKTLKQTLLPMFLLRLGLVPREIDQKTTLRPRKNEVVFHSGALHESKN